MNRNNIWIHVSIAVVIITIAAVLGQIDRWRAALKAPAAPTAQVDAKRDKKKPADDRKPEVLVRFKPGITLDRIRAIAGTNHDKLVDEIESVSGLSVIDDLDDADHGLLVTGVIEKRAVAFLHFLQMTPCGEIAHAGPGIAFGALLFLVIIGPSVGLGFEQPKRHH